MHVYEAVVTRRAVRRFADTPVSREVLERVLVAAARAPSSGNMQPWHAYVVAGAPRAKLKRRTAQRVAAGDPGDPPEYEMYPAELKSPYRERRRIAAEQRLAAMGAPREVAIAANWDAFGAPALLLCYIDRTMGAAQWADIGMYLQTVMLLLRAEGLHSCTQMAWSVYRSTVSEIVTPPDDLILFCGISIGYADAQAPWVRTDRAPFRETVRFLG